MANSTLWTFKSLHIQLRMMDENRQICIMRQEEQEKTERIIELAKRYGRYGYRRITAMPQNEGWKMNHKRVERIWRQEGL